MKIGNLNMHCGNCNLIDYCGEPYSDICICSESRFKNIDENKFLEIAKISKRKSKKAIINDTYKKLKGE